MRRVAKAIKKSPWIPQVPTIKQLEFLASPANEKLYGGAAGGGKSSALLMDAALGVESGDYAAILFRRTYSDLALPGAIMDRSKEWWSGTAAKWNDNEKTWTFPSGAKIAFGYLAAENDKYRYQSAEFQYIGFDELTQFAFSVYSYMRSRLRRTVDSKVALRMGNASNPGGIGHEWVYEEFIQGVVPERLFIPARLRDNPHLRTEEYEQTLSGLDPVTRDQLLKGLWVQDESSHPFKREWWRGKNRFLAGLEGAGTPAVIGRWISWDTALKDKESSAYNVAVVLELLADYRVRVRFVWREKLVFPELVPEIGRLAREWDYDGKLRGVVIEDKSSGTTAFQTIGAGADKWLKGMLVLFTPNSSKEERWSQSAVWCKRDCVEFPYPSEDALFLGDFEGELFGVPDSQFKDQADAFSQGVIYLEHLIAEGYRARLALDAA